MFIGLLYTAAPAVAAFARAGYLATVHGKPRAAAPAWLQGWEARHLATFADRNGDGVMQLSGDPGSNEVSVDSDVMVLAAPEMMGLAPWVVALVVAGALAAAISSAAGLLLVIAGAISHDPLKGLVAPRLSERAELWWARGVVGAAVLVAGWFGVHPPARVAQVVAYAFGLAASSFFPALVLGIFWKRATREGAMAGIISGVALTGTYIGWCSLASPGLGPRGWLGISPEGIGAVGMLLNFAVTVAVSLATRAPPRSVQDLVEGLRFPKESEDAAAPRAVEGRR